MHAFLVTLVLYVSGLHKMAPDIVYVFWFYISGSIFILYMHFINGPGTVQCACILPGAKVQNP